MGWTKYLELHLNVNGTNAIGSPLFNGFGESYKFPAGQYKISYLSGGVISYSSNIINPKYNRYELISGGLYFGQYSPSFFPEQKRYVWQCMYGTLPGFNENGFRNPEAIKTEYNENNYLEFYLNNASTLNFWYTDDCPACANGSIQYNVYKYEETESYANGITVLTMNIENPFEHEIAEFYHHRTPPPPQLDSTIPFTANVWMSHLKDISVNHVEDIKGFNSLGLKDNSKNAILLHPTEYNNMNSYPADTLNNKYSSYSYWKIVKNTKFPLYELLAEFTLDPITHCQGTPEYLINKLNADKYSFWYYDLLPGNYSIVYLSGATKTNQVSNHIDYGYSTYNLINIPSSNILFNETTPALSQQYINTFCCKYGTLPGTISTSSIIFDYTTAELATLAIQTKILNNELSGILNFSVTQPERLYIWFNDYNSNNNDGLVKYRLYKGFINNNNILKDFINTQNNLIENISNNVNTILSKNETTKYLKNIINNNETNNDKQHIINVNINKEYYIKKVNEIITIEEINYDETFIITNNIIGGPFFNINDAKNFIYDFCKLNNYDYEEIPNLSLYTIVIGEK